MATTEAVSRQQNASKNGSKYVDSLSMAGDSTRTRRYLGRRQLKTTRDGRTEMLREHSTLRALLKKCVVSSVLVAVPVLVAGNAWAQHNKKGGGKKVEPAVRLLSSVPIPVSASNPLFGKIGAGTSSFDISYVDQSPGTYTSAI